MKLFSKTPSRDFLLVLAGLFALGHAIMAVTATVGKSMTSDEIAHLTAGLAYNQRNDYRLQPENGNLPQRWAAIPMTIAGAKLPETTLDTWEHADVWAYGHALFYERGLSADEFLFLGRGMIALFSAATALLVFFWSRALFGWRGAFLSLGLYVFCPTFLAHGALATSDLVMTFFFLASVGAWWRHLEHPGMGRLVLSAVIFGLAFVAKFSAVLLIPMLALISAVWLGGTARNRGWRGPILQLLRSAGVHAAAAWIIIWLFYGFRFSAFAPGLDTGASFNHGWGWILLGMGAPAKAFYFLKEWHVLPEAWLYGFAFVIQFAQERGAFLNGEYSLRGWVEFFPFTFLVKTSLPLLALLTMTAAVALVRMARATRDNLGRNLWPLTPLAALFLVYWLTSLTSHLNIGHRHILPTYPVLFIAAGGLSCILDRRRWLLGSAVVGLLGWHVIESWRIRPHYLAYFNQIVGGPSHGWQHLVDSSLDWGQDLPGLAQWLRNNNAGPRPEPVFLGYFGTGDPVYEGIKATMLPTLPEVGPARNRPWTHLDPGLYCLSATMLQQVYSPVRGDWTLEKEREYQQLRPLEPTLLAYHRTHALQAEKANLSPEWNAVWSRYELLRFARLCHYLRARKPDAMIGYSILVYRVTPDELDAALNRNYSEWLQAVERAKN